MMTMDASGQLRAIADQYEKDGDPGERGFGVWGWRTIAEHLRKVADDIDRAEAGREGREGLVACPACKGHCLSWDTRADAYLCLNRSCNSAIGPGCGRSAPDSTGDEARE